MRMFPRLHLRAKRENLTHPWQNRDCLNRKWKGGRLVKNHGPNNRNLGPGTRTVVEDAEEAAVVEGAAAAERGRLQLQHKLQPPLLQKRMSLKQLVPHRHRE
jgi:hypothetical protein